MVNKMKHSLYLYCYVLICLLVTWVSPSYSQGPATKIVYIPYSFCANGPEGFELTDEDENKQLHLTFDKSVSWEENSDFDCCVMLDDSDLCKVQLNFGQMSTIKKVLSLDINSKNGWYQSCPTHMSYLGNDEELQARGMDGAMIFVCESGESEVEYIRNQDRLTGMDIPIWVSKMLSVGCTWDEVKSFCYGDLLYKNICKKVLRYKGNDNKEIPKFYQNRDFDLKTLGLSKADTEQLRTMLDWYEKNHESASEMTDADWLQLASVASRRDNSGLGEHLKSLCDDREGSVSVDNDSTDYRGSPTPFENIDDEEVKDIASTGCVEILPLYSREVQQFPQTSFRLAHFQLIKNDFIADEQGQTAAISAVGLNGW